MKVLVIGKGGREHALAYKASLSPLVSQVYVAPGNCGMTNCAKIVDISDSDLEGLVNFALKEKIDLTIVGPESSLELGVVDLFKEHGLKIFGPTKKAAQVETSKDFSKQIMKKYHIPTAHYETFTDYEKAKAYVIAKGAPIVLKEDGLKAGKGVVVALSLEEALKSLAEMFKQPNKVVIEEYLEGFEFSLMTFVNNDIVIDMEIAQDHKRAYDNDEGPNTGGMGVYSPVKKITKEIVAQAMEEIMIPMAKALVKENVPFTGFLYGGLMLTKDGIKTIEFNARFGDPEAEVILPRLQSDLVEVILKIMNNEKVKLSWSDEVLLGVVMASTNYPASATKDVEIENVEKVDDLLFHMGTRIKDGKLVTNGGRVLLVTGKGKTIEEAKKNAYTNVRKIKSKALFYRNDIGDKDIR